MMERLTKINSSGTGYFYPVCFKKCNGVRRMTGCEKCDYDAKYCNRLGQYEDLGLTPEQIRKIDVMYQELAEKLAKYEKLEIPAETMDKEKIETIEYIESNLRDGYIDFVDDINKLEIDILKEMVAEYKENHKIKTSTESDND